jgi:hypothetical protein
MTAREIADRYWQQQTTGLRFDKAQALAKRTHVSWEAVLTELVKDLQDAQIPRNEA